MVSVKWTEEAELDLENILTYYLDNAGMRVTEAVYNRIKTQIGSLNAFPERCRPGRVPGTKEYVTNRLPYIAVVAVGVDSITILNIMHTARKYPPNHP